MQKMSILLTGRGGNLTTHLPSVRCNKHFKQHSSIMAKTKSSQQLMQRKGRVSWRIRMLSQPRKDHVSNVTMPAVSEFGVRKSAIYTEECADRLNEMAYPYLWRLFALKKQYKHKFDESRVQKVNRLIEAGNTTMYAKLANSVVDLKKAQTKKSKAWNESEWKKHMEYITPLAEPKTIFLPRKSRKSKWKPLPQLMPRINMLAVLPPYKIYKRLSQEEWYRDPIKVSESAKTYVTSERIKKLAKPKEIPPPE